MVDVSAVAHGQWGQLDLDYACPCCELGLGTAPLSHSGKGGREGGSGVPWLAGGHQQD